MVKGFDLSITGTGYIQDERERRDSDFDIGSRDFGENFSPPDTINSDEDNSKLKEHFYCQESTIYISTFIVSLFFNSSSFLPFFS